MSTRELMHRMGHSSMRAALIYQHATSERDREIADNIDKRITDAKKKDAKKTARPTTARRKKRKGDDPDDGAAGVPAGVG